MALLATLFLAPPAAASGILRFETSEGNIDVRLFSEATPLSVANFLNYVTDGDYDGTFIHRAPRTFRVDSQGNRVFDEMGQPIIDTFVLQGGGFSLSEPNILGNVPTDDPVLNEPGLTNLPGTIAYAKVGPQFDLGGNLIPGTGPDSATSGFFFNTTNNVSNLDNQNGGFTVFARVVRGQEVLDAITDLSIFDIDGVNSSTFDDVPLTGTTGNLSDLVVTIDDVFLLPLSPADYNFDGVVNQSDYDVWVSQFGNSLHIAAHANGSPDTELDADGTGDAVVSAADFVLFRDFVGAPVAAIAPTALTAAVVPEPATAVGLALIAAMGFATRRRR